MKFPCRSIYESVYDGFELEIHVVDHCNLNCAGCNHFSPLAEKFFIKLEDFEDQLLIVKEKLPTIKKLMLLGGEPCLHPQLKELCIIARSIFPNIEIDVLTNGSLLKDILINSQIYIENQIHFAISKYSNIKYDNNIIKNLEQLSIAHYEYSRFLFLQPLVDVTGSQDEEKQFNIFCHVKKPCLTLKDYKIYECPFAAHINHFCKKFNQNIPLLENDYLDLYTVTLEQLENFCYQPKHICKYCKTGGNWLWHQSTKTIEEYTLTLNELYLKDYNTYLKIINNKDFLNNPEIEEHRDKVFGIDYYNKFNNRYRGKFDIIIPYYQIDINDIKRLLNTLSNQSIINNCCIYLISDGSPQEKEVVHLVSKEFENLNIIFLKNEQNLGPGVARNNGINNSFNSYIYFIDSDDYFINNNILELCYNNFIDNKELKYIAVPKQMENNIQVGDVDHVVRRDFLQNNNIFYGKFFAHEDLWFSFQIKTLLDLKEQMHLNTFGSVYNKNSQFNTGSRIHGKNLLWNRLYANYKCINFIKNNLDKIKNFSPLIDLYNEINNINSFLLCYSDTLLNDKIFMQSCFIMIHFLISFLLPIIKNNCINKQDINIPDVSISDLIDINNYNYVINQQKITTIEEMDQFFIDNIKSLSKQKDNKYLFTIYEDYIGGKNNG